MCSANYTGDRCELEKTCENYCLNGAECEVKQDKTLLCRYALSTPCNCCRFTDIYVCIYIYISTVCIYSCRPGFYGARCAAPLPCQRFCENGANCTVEQDKKPVCHCPKGLGGEKCDKIIAKNCNQLECHYGGICYSQPSSGRPMCSCKTGWMGLVCALPTCSGYCMNRGACLLKGGSAWCK